MHWMSKFQGLHRRVILSLVAVALMIALLPTAAFAGSYGRPGRNYYPQQNYQRHDRNHGKHYNSCATTYKVRKGDALSNIARHYRVSVRELSKANGIKNPNRIYAGQRLCIPR